MPTLNPEQRRAIAKSIRAQYANSDTYVPGKVAKARGLRLVLQKDPETKSNKLKKGISRQRNRLAALQGKVAKTKLELQKELSALKLYQDRYKTAPTAALGRIIERQKERIAKLRGM